MGNLEGKVALITGAARGQGRAHTLHLAANFDPEQFPKPLDVDIDRANVASHAAFGAGIHRCLGAHLARREIKVMVRAISELSEFRLAPGVEIAWRASMARGLSPRAHSQWRADSGPPRPRSTFGCHGSFSHSTDNTWAKIVCLSHEEVGGT
jgi:hypothetical protein